MYTVSNFTENSSDVSVLRVLSLAVCVLLTSTLQILYILSSAVADHSNKIYSLVPGWSHGAENPADSAQRSFRIADSCFKEQM